MVRPTREKIELANFSEVIIHKANEIQNVHSNYYLLGMVLTLASALTVRGYV